jgi:hypothetical protein
MECAFVNAIYLSLAKATTRKVRVSWNRVATPSPVFGLQGFAHVGAPTVVVANMKYEDNRHESG